jgi:membrane-associated phospholipid phosphatase
MINRTYAFLLGIGIIGISLTGVARGIAEKSVVEQSSVRKKKRDNRKIKHRYLKKKPYDGRDARRYARNLFYDAVELHKNLFTWDSFKVASMVFPLFVGSRMIDERLQHCFYDSHHHKNIDHIPRVCHDLAQWSISVPIIVLGSQIFWAQSEEMRETSRIFLLGLPFVIWTKTIIKKLRFEENLRPWHENFDKEKRCSGGFPSGHMAEAAYTALLYGMRFGPKFAIPLGAVATFIGVSFVACNRHYLSQIVAGAGLGALYAVAANKLVDAKVAHNMKFGVKFEKGSPAFQISYQF